MPGYQGAGESVVGLLERWPETGFGGRLSRLREPGGQVPCTGNRSCGRISGQSRPVSTAIVVAAISGGVSLVAASLSYANARRVAILNDQLEEQRRARSKQEQAAEVRARYRDPLLGVVFDLQSRLYNIVAKRFLRRYLTADDPQARSYAIESTLYVLAEYLGWVEILRREVQFLDLGDEAANRGWINAFERVRDTLARDDLDPVLRIFRGEQRAIGEVMTLAVADSGAVRRLESMGYATFVTRLGQAEFSRWFEQLTRDVELLGQDPDAHAERPILLQNALVDVLDVLDPGYSRFAAERRTRLPMPDTGIGRT